MNISDADVRPTRDRSERSYPAFQPEQEQREEPALPPHLLNMAAATGRPDAMDPAGFGAVQRSVGNSAAVSIQRNARAGALAVQRSHREVLEETLSSGFDPVDSGYVSAVGSHGGMSLPPAVQKVDAGAADAFQANAFSTMHNGVNHIVARDASFLDPKGTTLPEEVAHGGTTVDNAEDWGGVAVTGDPSVSSNEAQAKSVASSFAASQTVQANRDSSVSAPSSSGLTVQANRDEGVEAPSVQRNTEEEMGEMEDFEG